MKLYKYLLILFLSPLIVYGQVVNDECSTAIDYGELDGRRKSPCPDNRMCDTSFTVSNLNAVPNFPYYNTSNICYTSYHDTINSVYNDVWYKFKPSSGINGITIFNNKSSLYTDTIRITYWLDDGSGCGHFFGGVTQIIPLTNNYFYYEFGYLINYQDMYLQITGNKPKDTIDLTMCLSGSKFSLYGIVCCLMGHSYDSICFINNLSHKNPSSISSKDGSITSSVSLGHPPYKYLWNTGDSSSKIEGLASGKYYLTITDSIGCINKYAIDLTATASILNNNELENIIYPNPARDKLYIKQSGISKIDYKIYDLVGKKLLTGQTRENIDVSMLSEGLYLLHISTKDGNMIMKFEIKR